MSACTMTAAQVCQAFGISRATLSRWHHKHGLRFERGDCFRYDPEHIRTVLKGSEAARRDAASEKGRKAAEQGKRRHIVNMALDVEDLAHMTTRGLVDMTTWLRVCRGRFRSWPVTDEQLLRTFERWKARARRMNLPMRLVYVDDQDAPLMRFDWPSVLRWTRRVLDAA